MMWLYIRLCNECFMFEHKDVYMFIVIFIHKCNPSQIKEKPVNDYRRVKLIKSFQMPKCVNFQIKWKKKALERKSFFSDSTCLALNRLSYSACV